VSRVEDRLQACLLPHDLAKDFGLPEGHPLLLSVRTAFDLRGAPVEYRRSWIITTSQDYLSELHWVADSNSP
jgi:GntR family transcriptional regulator